MLKGTWVLTGLSLPLAAFSVFSVWVLRKIKGQNTAEHAVVTLKGRADSEKSVLLGERGVLRHKIRVKLHMKRQLLLPPKKVSVVCIYTSSSFSVLSG